MKTIKKLKIKGLKPILIGFTIFVIVAGITHVLGWWNVYRLFGFPTPYN